MFVGAESLDVAVADTTALRARGLMGVDALPGDVDGMLFVFDPASDAAFHMEDTTIPLDIWWFDGAGVLLGKDSMQPCPGAPCRDYPSPGSIGWALETPAGDYDFDVGDLLSTGEYP